MKYYFLEGTFKEGRPEGLEFKKALDAHHTCLLYTSKNRTGADDGGSL